jgi:hypothetical protein
MEDGSDLWGQEMRYLLSGLNKGFSAYTALGHNETRYWTRAYEQLQCAFAEHSLLLPPGESVDIPPDWQPEVSNPRDLHEIRRRLTTICTDMIEPNRRAHLSPHQMSLYEITTVEQIWELLHVAYGDEAHQGVPRQITYAVEKYIADRQSELYAADAAYLASAEVQQPTFDYGNYETQLIRLLGVTDPRAFIQSVLDRYPPELLRRFTGIAFEDALPPMTHSNGTTEKPAANANTGTGKMSINMDPSVLGGMKPTYSWQGYSQAYPADASQKKNQERLRNCIDHELFHTITLRGQPIEFLLKWTGLVDAESYFASLYVEDAYRIGPHRGWVEDLADSGKHYMNQPWTLRESAGKRFETYQKLLGRYDEELLRSLDQNPDSYEPMLDIFSSDELLIMDADDRMEQRRQDSGNA